MSKENVHTDTGLLEDLRRDPERTLAVLYRKYKQVFLGYVRKFGGEPEDHLEVYHDAVLAFYDIWQMEDMRLTVPRFRPCSAAIGKNKLLTKLGKQSKHVEWTEITPMIDPPEEVIVIPEEMLITRVEKAMNNLGDGCKEIITLFYYQRFSVRDIVDRLNYKNENVVKAHKSRA